VIDEIDARAERLPRPASTIARTSVGVSDATAAGMLYQSAAVQGVHLLGPSSHSVPTGPSVRS